MTQKKHIINPIQIESQKDFGLFYSLYYQRFVRYAFYYINDLSSAHDITHDALIYYWENKSTFSSDTDVLGYILKTVKNKCLNHLVHLQVKTKYNKKCADLYEWEINIKIHTLENESYDHIFSKDIMDIVSRALSELPIQTREIFVLNRFENKPRKEIAETLKVSQQKIDYHINKANAYLRLKLKDYLPLLLFFIN